jgi:CBS domain-containing protein
VRDLLENPRFSAKRYYDLGMILLVLTSVALLVYSVKNTVVVWMLLFEDLVVSVFIIEYLARVWITDDMHRTVLDHYRQTEFLRSPFQLRPVLAVIARRKWEYVSSMLAIIDLLAILPSYRTLRLLRVFLLFRLFTLFRYSRSVHGMTEVLSERRFEFYTLAFFDRNKIKQVTQFTNTKVVEAMIPIAKINAVNVKHDLNHVMELVYKYGIHRVHVYKDSAGNIVGVPTITTWDMLEYDLTERPISEMVKPVLYISPYETVDQVLPILAEREDRMATVVDEFSSAIGMVTMEDILREVIGDIEVGFMFEQLLPGHVGFKKT